MITSATSTPASAAAPAQNEAQLRQAAQAFEAVFLRQVIGSMRQAKLADDVFGSAATDQFRDMADGRLADDMSKRGSFGIAEMLLRQFSRHPAAAGNPAAATTAAAGPTGDPS